MSKRKLLLADDSVTIQKVVNLTFADEGIEVISVGDGDSAMEKVMEISPDLIMADVNMPGLTGYEICERIRQDENLRHTPVILLVGSFEPFDEDEARRVGANDYLTKPFQSIRQLVNKVTLLLDSANGEGNIGSFEDTLELDPAKKAGIIEQEQYLAPTEPLQYPADMSFDDEMIQTNRPSNFPFDETSKFEARETDKADDVLQNESEAENYEESAENSSGEFGKTESVSDENKDEETGVSEIERTEYSYEPETKDEASYEIKDFPEDFEKPADVSDDLEGSVAAQIEDAATDSDTENVSYQNNDAQTEDENPEDISAELKDSETTADEDEETEDTNEIISDKEDENSLEDTKNYSFVGGKFKEITAAEEAEEGKTDESEEIESENNKVELTQKTSEEEIPLPESASVLEFDDDDILQLPPFESELEEEDEIEKSVPAQIAPAESETSDFVPTAKNTTSDSSQISPELIDAIVAKVMEKLSEKAVKEVAWEVVPQMTELIVTKMAEEKLKE